jgi:glycosyltransferase involved in cell wall biosynthesis
MTADSSARGPRFSIIMNVYNGRAWLDTALASVFAQTCQDWELIFWDDRSTDSSGEALEPYRRDDRVRYFLADRQVPLGKARELAIQEASGEWLAFLDQDDIWTPDKLEKQARLIDDWQGPPLGIVYGRAMKFGVDMTPRDFDHWHEFDVLPEGNIFQALFVDSCFICQSAVCLRTDATRAVGEVPAEYRFCPDYFFYADIASRYAAACSQDVVCWYRVHATAMSRERYEDILVEMLHVLYRWQERLPKSVCARRSRIQHTLLALHRIRGGRDVFVNLSCLLRQGSLVYLFSRPFVNVWRSVRRLVMYQVRGRPKLPEGADLS